MYRAAHAAHRGGGPYCSRACGRAALTGDRPTGMAVSRASLMHAAPTGQSAYAQAVTNR